MRERTEVDVVPADRGKLILPGHEITSDILLVKENLWMKLELRWDY